MSVLRIEKLIKFLKERFESGIQMFDTPSLDSEKIMSLVADVIADRPMPTG